ncbi:lyase family protein [Mycobacterium marseillense]|uniref:3-carboxy-cis,cis-muconate cycloisomerase n=1 Tax=Mycobacterium marseillense TaxID=701042 RepID=A0AAC9VVH6_9MYCO|nr:lyase family protein [Mycobacterium marseillense]ASW91139.1 3-carboxy-cis,cis-muconate cycloisomerase [Mycobacterium marseillense]MCA2265223.1 3-carboxy-cis,cis-muconate cycloisomerase [Mycobacterium marseillense]MDM3976738.1 lyase family protein [Mycobacterium marseillense]OBJ75059.1 3-carboxy-cis,cis-muconate cycloisomerase [Mycobacterium marseillense]
MTNLLWPGDHRAGEHMTDEALLGSMVAVESAWLSALAGAGLAPTRCAGADLWDLVTHNDCEALAVAAEDGGNPVVGLVTLLRHRAEPAVAPWIHRGLTSQDVLDTSLMLATRAVADDLLTQLREQISALSELVTRHRATPMVARTLTQHAAPTTFGAKAAGWLHAVVDAFERVATLSTPAQIGGAAGTLAATTELAALLTGTSDPAGVSARLAADTATALGLALRPPWHTARAPITAAGDALVGCTDGWGRIASDIVTLARPEIAELSEPTADNRGGSSSMPHKRNPVLSILIRRAALSAPPLAATLHTAAALANDERPDGAWHAEWDTLRTLGRRTVVAGSHTAELLTGLTVHTQRMAENLDAADVLGEQQAVAELAGKRPSPTYFGTVDRLVDDSLGRAARALAQR